MRTGHIDNQVGLLVKLLRLQIGGMRALAIQKAAAAAATHSPEECARDYGRELGRMRKLPWDVAKGLVILHLRGHHNLHALVEVARLAFQERRAEGAA